MSKQLVENQIVDTVQARVEEMTSQGELHLPENYSPENALKSAWLKLQTVKTSNHKPVLEACNKSSIANALLRMITMGLNPEKDQCYFIAYGKMLSCQPSYFGKEKIVKSQCGVQEIYKRAIFKEDIVEIEVQHGNERVVNHETAFENKFNDLLGAYAVAVFEDERPDKHTVMTIDEIKQAWKQGQTYKKNGNGTHQKFGKSMARKTASSRLCKEIINSTDDSSLALDAYNKSDTVQAEQEAQEEIEENANSQVLDIDYGETEEGPAPQPEPEENEVEQEEPEEDPAAKTEKERPGQTEGPDFE
jgi:recombination protein RecT